LQQNIVKADQNSNSTGNNYKKSTEETYLTNFELSYPIAIFQECCRGFNQWNCSAVQEESSCINIKAMNQLFVKIRALNQLK
jgi:hypothetical protein